MTELTAHMNEEIDSYLNEMYQQETPFDKRKKAEEILQMAKEDIGKAEEIAESLNFNEFRCGDCGQEKLYDQKEDGFYCPMCGGQ